MDISNLLLFNSNPRSEIQNVALRKSKQKQQLSPRAATLEAAAAAKLAGTSRGAGGMGASAANAANAANASQGNIVDSLRASAMLKKVNVER